MQVNVEDVSTVKKILHFELPNEKLTEELDKAYVALKKNAKVKGFRPGKAPRSVLERIYKKDVHEDVSSRLIQESFIEGLKELELNILGAPQIDPTEIDPESPFRFDATIEIKPKIETVDFKGIKLNKTIYNVTDEMIDSQLSMLQKNLAKKEPIKEARPIQMGDFAFIDYEGFKDGEPHSATPLTENYSFEVGHSSVIGAFDDQIVGMNAGENKEFAVSFPEDHPSKDLAKLDITFKVSLKEIHEEILPEIDDELAKGLGNYDSLDAVKLAIRDNLAQGYDKRTEQELSEQIFQALLEKTDFEVPGVMVDFELQQIIAEAEKSFQYHNMSFEEAGISKETLEEKYRDTAEKQARRHLILGQIVDQEALALSDDELDAGLKEMAEAYRQPFEDFKKYMMTQTEQLAYFKETLLEKNAIKLILESSDINEKEAEETTKDESTD
jgi:trigger factor